MGNLGGFGKDGGAKNMRFSNVIKQDGVALDLVIANTSEYTTTHPEHNGLVTGTSMVEVNVDAETSGDLNFQFVKAGTSEPYEVASFLLSFWISIRGRRGRIESG